MYDDIDTTFTERSCTPLGEWEVGCYHIPHPIENITKCICDTDLCNGGNEKGIFPGKNSCPRDRYTPYIVLLYPMYLICKVHVFEINVFLQSYM